MSTSHRSTTVQMESERLRNALLGAISHDLRTPLAALAGMADSLQLTAPPLAPAHAEIAQSLREAAVRMNALVNNLLDMARLESGRVALNLQWQPLEEVVGSALRSLGGLFAGSPSDQGEPAGRPAAAALRRGAGGARAGQPAGERGQVHARRQHHFHRRGGVAGLGGGVGGRRRARACRRGSEERLFEKFERGRKESATPGVGLGLAICRAIVLAHGGTIRGETRPEGGARFVFTLPRGEPPRIEEPVDDDNGGMDVTS